MAWGDELVCRAVLCLGALHRAAVLPPGHPAKTAMKVCGVREYSTALEQARLDTDMQGVTSEKGTAGLRAVVVPLLFALSEIYLKALPGAAQHLATARREHCTLLHIISGHPGLSQILWLPTEQTKAAVDQAAVNGFLYELSNWMVSATATRSSCSTEHLPPTPAYSTGDSRPQVWPTPPAPIVFASRVAALSMATCYAYLVFLELLLLAISDTTTAESGSQSRDTTIIYTLVYRNLRIIQGLLLASEGSDDYLRDPAIGVSMHLIPFQGAALSFSESWQFWSLQALNKVSCRTQFRGAAFINTWRALRQLPGLYIEANSDPNASTGVSADMEKVVEDSIRSDILSDISSGARITGVGQRGHRLAPLCRRCIPMLQADHIPGAVDDSFLACLVRMRCGGSSYTSASAGPSTGPDGFVPFEAVAWARWEQDAAGEMRNLVFTEKPSRER
ncbi:hypothetical protein BJX64DRAFT_287528 [Aspergillus heterothallicus]